MHSGVSHLEETVKLNFDWHGMMADIFKYVEECLECQQFKKHHKNYEEVPVSTPGMTLWEAVAVAMIGPWMIPSNGQLWWQ
jgi:Integrase zinc binding domain